MPATDDVHVSNSTKPNHVFVFSWRDRIYVIFLVFAEVDFNHCRFSGQPFATE